MTIKTTSDNAAVVDTEFHWVDVNARQPPLGTKILVINKTYGVATIGLWQRSSWWTHWAPLPTFKKNDDSTP